MNLLTKGIVIRGKDLISVTVFMAFTGSFAVTLRAVAQFIYFESFGAPPSLILIIPPSFASGAIFGGFLLDRVRRRKPFFLLFFAWAFVPFLPIIFKAVSVIPIHLTATGILQGLTYPAVRSFLADVTEVYERGRVAGLGWSGMGLLSVIMVLVISRSLDMFLLFTVFWELQWDWLVWLLLRKGLASRIGEEFRPEVYSVIKTS